MLVGCALRRGERPPAVLLEFAAERIGVLPDAMYAYRAAQRNRPRHSVETGLTRCRSAGRTPARLGCVRYQRLPSGPPCPV